MNIRSARAMGIGLTLAFTALGLSAPVQAGQVPGVCNNVTDCDVVAHTDVDGDGAKDEVGLAPTAEENVYELRVLTSTGKLATVTRPSSVASDDVWQGKARLDAHPGRELLLTNRYQTGDRFYHVLTWRRGGLVRLEQPGGGGQWQITGNGRGVRGFLRSKKMAVGTIRERFATPADSSGETYDGTRTTYKWKKHAWKKVGTSTTTITAERAVLHWYGWHVDHLSAT